MCYDWIKDLKKRIRENLLEALLRNIDVILRELRIGIPISITKNGFVITFMLLGDVEIVKGLLAAR